MYRVAHRVSQSEGQELMWEDVDNFGGALDPTVGQAECIENIMK